MHQQLKAALTTYKLRECWLAHLPFILLGIRTAQKTDLGFPLAELVYDISLHLPGELFVPSLLL